MVSFVIPALYRIAILKWNQQKGYNSLLPKSILKPTKHKTSSKHKWNQQTWSIDILFPACGEQSGRIVEQWLGELLNMTDDKELKGITSKILVNLNKHQIKANKLVFSPDVSSASQN